MSRSREGTRYTDEVLWLDVREIARQGPMVAGRRWSVAWSRGGESIADIQLGIETAPEDASRLTLVLNYAVGPTGGELIPVRDRFRLEATACHFGGARWWLRCRSCGDRVAVVYAASVDHRFVCRRCGRLAYRTTRIDELSRIDRRRWRLADRLGYPASYPRDHIPWRHLPRPARMRPETFERLVWQGVELEHRANDLWIGQVSRLLAQCDRTLIARGVDPG